MSVPVFLPPSNTPCTHIYNGYRQLLLLPFFIIPVDLQVLSADITTLDVIFLHTLGHISDRVVYEFLTNTDLRYVPAPEECQWC
jgi:hypothetical protein